MHNYMVAVRRRVDALESREFLRAAINAPHWSDQLHRDLLKEVVKVWLAISSGRFQDERYLACCQQPECRPAHPWYLGAYYHRNHHGGLA